MASTHLQSSLADRYFQVGEQVYASTRRLTNYTDVLFEGVPLAGRSLLDIGGGSGVLSYYAAVCGAGPVVCLEPSDAGSNTKMDEAFCQWQSALSPEVSVDLVRATFQDLDPTDRQYDVVLIHSAVNHLDEDACARLPSDGHARRVYGEMFTKLASLTAPGGDLVISDAGRSNGWAAVGLTSPFARTIDWRVHADPQVWAELACAAGFTSPRIRWQAPAALGPVGQWSLGHRLGGYLTNSKFVLNLKRRG